MALLSGAHRVAPCEACHDTTAGFSSEVITCNGVALLPGTGTGAAVDWTQDCLTCHECNRPQAGDVVCGQPSPGVHFAGQSCGDANCHAFSSDAWNGLGEEGIRFCDGGGGGCQQCHDEELGGTHQGNGAPASPSHDAHLSTTYDGLPDGQGGYVAGYDCDVCHPDGGSSAATHENGTLDVRLDEGGASFGTFDAGAGTCAVTCHGNGPTPTLTYSLRVTVVAGAADTPILPIWDQTDLGGGCDSCHGSPPVVRGDDVAPVYHAAPATQCNVCHEPTGDTDPSVVPPDGYVTHLNGSFQCTNGGVCP